MEQNPLIGKTVMAVHLAEDGGAIKFDLQGGETIIARADGDCCSHTWIQEVQGVEQLIASPVVSVKDVGVLRPAEQDGELQFYGCKITTGKGYALIDYRNESNGYYGGNLVWPGDYFYGGVHGQNISKEVWRELRP